MQLDYFRDCVEESLLNAMTISPIEIELKEPESALSGQRRVFLE